MYDGSMDWRLNNSHHHHLLLPLITILAELRFMHPNISPGLGQENRLVLCVPVGVWIPNLTTTKRKQHTIVKPVSIRSSILDEGTFPVISKWCGWSCGLMGLHYYLFNWFRLIIDIYKGILGIWVQQPSCKCFPALSFDVFCLPHLLAPLFMEINDVFHFFFFFQELQLFQF